MYENPSVSSKYTKNQCVTLVQKLILEECSLVCRGKASLTHTHFALVFKIPGTDHYQLTANSAGWDSS